MCFAICVESNVSRLHSAVMRLLGMPCALFVSLARGLTSFIVVFIAPLWNEHDHFRSRLRTVASPHTSTCMTSAMPIGSLASVPKWCGFSNKSAI